MATLFTIRCKSNLLSLRLHGFEWGWCLGLANLNKIKKKFQSVWCSWGITCDRSLIVAVFP